MNPISLPHDHGQHSQQLTRQMPGDDVFSSVADAFKMLSDGKRMQIYWLLCHCEECVINISAMVSMSSPAVSHHLKLLKNAGLITSRREGKEVYYTAVKSGQAAQLHSAIEKLIAIRCPLEAEHAHE
jgi:DNA-binding transcriptional ArsR family regulator